jgi:hypothetical protein
MDLGFTVKGFQDSGFKGCSRVLVQSGLLIQGLVVFMI